jgi:glycosyltransferase involved in cell wall biosynthesis
MRVVHVLNELKPSGAEVMLKLAAPYWTDAGVASTIWATGKAAGAYAPELAGVGYGIHHERVASASQLLRGRWSPSLRAAIAGADAVHLHSERSAMLFALACRRMGARRIIRTVHNNFAFGARVRLRVGLERWMARRLGVLHVAISPSVVETEWKQYRNPTPQILNWVDVAHMRPPSAAERAHCRRELGVPENACFLVSVGNGSPVKNYGAIVGAMGRLRDPRLRFAQVGNPRTDGADARLAQELGLTESCSFVGPQQNVRDWLWAADLYLMPSYFEGFGLAAAEALVCGLPCVFARVPGLADWDAPDLPIFWSGTDAASVASALQQARDARAEPRLTGGVERLREALSPARGAAAYLALYKGASPLHP